MAEMKLKKKEINQGKQNITSGYISYQIYRKYIAPIVIGPLHPYDVNNKTIKIGTVYFIQGKEKFAVTCYHCIQSFIEWKQKEPNIFLKIGNSIFGDIEQRLITYDKNMDICTFKFSDDDMKRINRELTYYIYQKPIKLNKNDTICIIGFPGALTYPTSETNLEIGEFGVFETLLDFEEDNSSFIIQLRSDEWNILLNQSKFNLNKFENPGGLSGAPVFFQNRLYPTIIGTVYQDFNFLKNAIQVRKTCYDETGNLI
jgi:hypothetical protein